jgi:hypothetical protein
MGNVGQDDAETAQRRKRKNQESVSSPTPNIPK